MKSFLVLLALLPSLATGVVGQTLTQTVRGQVRDETVQTPLAGATLKIETATGQILGGLTDDEGRFAIAGVPVGRATVTVTYLGYTPLVLANLQVVSGKELNLNLLMVEDYAVSTDEVTVSADRVIGQINNEFSTLSTRPFATEEANRYAGSLGDPARMATNFAGVVSAGDTRNDIVVRGNSPLGLLWRLEGVDIPNPNHFSTQGANGGPVSILNNNTLDNSDFATGAFAAEYGNATSGVFDLKLRTGNTAKRETSFQIGFAGFELLTEGPFKAGSTSSYLIGARYSTLAVFDAIGLQFGSLLGIPYFQDVTIKTDFDVKKLGRLSFFAVGGYSTIDILESELDEVDWNDSDIIDELAYQDIRQKVGSATAGLALKTPLGTRTLLKNTLALSYEWRDLRVDTVFSDQTTGPNFGERYRVNTLQWASSATFKPSAKVTWEVGLFAKHYQYDVQDSIARYSGADFTTYPTRDIDEGTTLLQVYAQNQWRVTERLTLTTGLHALNYSLNDQSVVEPRASLRYQAGKATSLTLGYGLHHQTQVATLYFSRDTVTGEQGNRDLEMTQSQHLVAGIETTLPGQVRIKLEGYTQWLDNIPIDPYASTFSAVNLGANFQRPPDRVGFVNNGTAETRGVELTLEKAFVDTWYGLVTASLFESTYTAGDGRQYNSAYNNGYVINALAGVELPVGKARNAQVFGDVRVALAGGFRYTPTDLAASQAAGYAVEVPQSAFSEQAPGYVRIDLKLGIRQNYRRWSQELSIQLQNISDQQNVFTRQYNPRTGQITDRYQLGFFPVPQYKIYF